MRTKQKLYSFYSLTLTHMMWYTQMRTTHKTSHIQCIKTMQFVMRIYAYKILSYLYAYTHMRKRRLQGRRLEIFRLREKNGAREFVPGLSGLLSQRCSCLQGSVVGGLPKLKLSDRTVILDPLNMNPSPPRRNQIWPNGELSWSTTTSLLLAGLFNLHNLTFSPVPLSEEPSIPLLLLYFDRSAWCSISYCPIEEAR